MIFIIIAGSYTPLCMLTLRDSVAPLMCHIDWSIAPVGILIKACWITCPKWFSSIIYTCLTEPAGFSLIPRTFFPIPTAPEDTTIISFPLGWLLIPFRFSSFQFIFLVGINKRSRKRVCGDTFFCFFFHYRIIILQWLNKTYHFFIPSEMNILSCIYWIHAFPDLQYWIFCSVPLKDTVDAGM